MIETDLSKRKKPGKRGFKRVLLWGSQALLLAVCGWLLFGGWDRPAETPQEQSRVVPEQVMLREVSLYFSSEDGSHLVAESRSIEDCLEESDCIRSVVEALVEGSEQGAVEVLPTNTRLIGVDVDGPLVSVDFDSTFVDGHPGGTQSELLTVYALADTLAVNFPHLRQLRILVEGAPIETIKGHVDLRQPITPDYSLVEEVSAPSGDLSNVPARSE